MVGKQSYLNVQLELNDLMTRKSASPCASNIFLSQDVAAVVYRPHRSSSSLALSVHFLEDAKMNLVISHKSRMQYIIYLSHVFQQCLNE